MLSERWILSTPIKDMCLKWQAKHYEAVIFHYILILKCHFMWHKCRKLLCRLEIIFYFNKNPFNMINTVNKAIIIVNM